MAPDGTKLAAAKDRKIRNENKLYRFFYFSKTDDTVVQQRLGYSTPLLMVQNSVAVLVGAGVKVRLHLR